MVVTVRGGGKVNVIQKLEYSRKYFWFILSSANYVERMVEVAPKAGPSQMPAQSAESRKVDDFLLALTKIDPRRDNLTDNDW